MLSVLNETEEKWLSEARSFHELADIAMVSLRRLPPPVVQVCGPMSTGGKGTLQENMAYFYEAIHFLHSANFSVFDQIRFQGKMLELIGRNSRVGGRRYHKDILYHFYSTIFDSGIILIGCFLPDWHTSLGATWERAKVGLSDHMRCIDMPGPYVKEIDAQYHARRIRGE